MRSRRVDLIEQYILKKQSTSLEDICKEFDISMSTVRRDLDEIIRHGKVEKVYGGVRIIDTPHSQSALIAYEQRNIINSEEKKIIGQKAASLVEAGDVVFIDTGSTCAHIIESIKTVPCTVVTNSLWVALGASSNSNIDLIMAPGHLNRKTGSFTGHDILPYLKAINIKKAFMAATGVSLDNGATNASEDEYIIKKTVCQNAAEVFLLVDHDKINRTALYTYARLSDFSGIITDCEPSDDFAAYCREHNISLLF